MFMVSPALGFDIVDMDMRALGDVGNRPPDIAAIFQDRVAAGDIMQGDLVANRHILGRLQVKTGIVGGDHAKHFRASLQALDNDHAARIFRFMHKKMGDHGLVPGRLMSYIRHKRQWGVNHPQGQ